ncbi:MAG TPA: hypothetical protein PK765_02925 [bacterium]|nr:hypothetical protein [bacterium]
MLRIFFDTGSVTPSIVAAAGEIRSSTVIRGTISRGVIRTRSSTTSATPTTSASSGR